MSDDKEIHTLIGKIEKVIATLDGMSSEQHEIKKSIDKIEIRLDATSKETTRNEINISNLDKRLSEQILENKEQHKRIYENMDKKESVIMNKVKVWILGGVVSFCISVALIYLR